MAAREADFVQDQISAKQENPFRILSVQMQSVGHRVYGEILREVSSSREDIQLDSFWAHDERSLATKVLRRLAETRAPVLSKMNLDFRRARAEWSTGQMSRKLATKKLQGQNYDALHFHTQTAAYGSVQLMRKIKTFITIDMTVFQLVKEFNAGPRWTYLPNFMMERNTFNNAAHIIAFSDWARNSVIEDYHIKPERITTITPGVRIEMFSVPNFELRAKPRVLFVGNDFIRKGGDDLLAVFLESFRGQAELHLVTNDEIEIRDPSVHVHQKVSAYSGLWQSLYQQSEIFVMVSRSEALGMVFQEAAAAGLALIGTNVGGIPEMITHGGNGFVISPGDRAALSGYLKILIEDVELRQKMRKASRERALRDFDASRNTDRLLTLFSSSAK